jgi:hypothetical protein
MERDWAAGIGNWGVTSGLGALGSGFGMELSRSKLGEDFFFCRETDGLGWTGRYRKLRLFDTAEEDVAQPVGRFVIQSKVRILFHNIQGIAEFVGQFRFRSADRHGSILAG